jgi:hypothetical protein
VKEHLALAPPPANRKAVPDTPPLPLAQPEVCQMNDVSRPAFTRSRNRASSGGITATDSARLIDEQATPPIRR